ncbi:hypothetical protein ABEF93_005635 [Exophiala dermatitidis]
MAPEEEQLHIRYVDLIANIEQNGAVSHDIGFPHFLSTLTDLSNQAARNSEVSYTRIVGNGFTLSDGPWMYRITKGEVKRDWQMLRTRADFNRMMDEVFCSCEDVCVEAQHSSRHISSTQAAKTPIASFKKEAHSLSPELTSNQRTVSLNEMARYPKNPPPSPGKAHPPQHLAAEFSEEADTAKMAEMPKMVEATEKMVLMPKKSVGIPNKEIVEAPVKVVEAPENMKEMPKTTTSSAQEADAAKKVGIPVKAEIPEIATHLPVKVVEAPKNPTKSSNEATIAEKNGKEGKKIGELPKQSAEPKEEAEMAKETEPADSNKAAEDGPEVPKQTGETPDKATQSSASVPAKAPEEPEEPEEPEKPSEFAIWEQYSWPPVIVDSSVIHDILREQRLEDIQFGDAPKVVPMKLTKDKPAKKNDDDDDDDDD